MGALVAATRRGEAPGRGPVSPRRQAGSGAREFRVEDLVGRPVCDREGRRIGRVTELRVERRGGALEVTGVLIGTWGWIERLAMQKVWRRGRGWLARWDQVDFTDLTRPRLRVPRSALALEPPGGAAGVRGARRAGR